MPFKSNAKENPGGSLEAHCDSNNSVSKQFSKQPFHLARNRGIIKFDLLVAIWRRRRRRPMIGTSHKSTNKVYWEDEDERCIWICDFLKINLRNNPVNLFKVNINQRPRHQRRGRRCSLCCLDYGSCDILEKWIYLRRRYWFGVWRIRQQGTVPNISRVASTWWAWYGRAWVVDRC